MNDTQTRKVVATKTLAWAIGPLLFIAISNTLAQSYPVKPIRMIVPFTVGGGVDFNGRAFSQRFADAWGQPLVVENRAGAGGNIGADVIAKAAPDGYTLMVTTTGRAVAATLYRKLPFDPIKNFTAISQVTENFLLLVTHPSMPPSMKELIAHARANPGKLNYGHPGVGVAPHLIGGLLKAHTAASTSH